MFIVTNNLHHDGYFYPRIPQFRKEREDGTIERICAAQTLEGCLSAFPAGGRYLKATLALTFNILKVFRIIPEKLNLSSSDIKHTMELKYLVDDAHLTGEYWILKPFQVGEEDVFYIFCRQWEEDVEHYKLIPFGSDRFEQAVLIKELKYDVLNYLPLHASVHYELESFMDIQPLLQYLRAEGINYDIREDKLLMKTHIGFCTKEKRLDVSSFFKEWYEQYCDYFQIKIKSL